MNAFEQLVQDLKRSPTQPAGITAQSVPAGWESLRDIKLKPGAEVPPALLLALILFDETTFAGLVTGEQLDQLHLLSHAAQQAYERAIKPKNQVGQLLVTTIKESKNV